MSLGVEWVSKYESRDLVVYQSVYTEICCSNKLLQSLWLKTTQVFLTLHVHYGSVVIMLHNLFILGFRLIELHLSAVSVVL